MTPRERMLRVLAHELPDRIPAVWGARPEVDRAVAEYYGVDTLAEALEILGVDRRAGVGLRVSFPEFEKRGPVPSSGDWMGAGGRYIFHDARTFENEWGVVQRIGEDGKYVEWVSGPLVDASDPDAFDFPGIDRIVDDPNLAEKVRTHKENGLFVSSSVVMPYKLAWMLRGMENLLADYLINRPFIETLYDRIFAVHGEVLRRCTAAGIDMIGFGGDIAMQDRMIMGPDSWRAVDKPRLAEVIASCKAINPDLHVFIHSDGDLRAIMPDLIEIGFDVIDPIQPECMDPAEIKRLYGDRITLHGCGSLQRTLPFGTPEDCRQEVAGLIETCGTNGGLVLRVSNAIGFDVPVENVVAWFEAARDYDLSRLG